MSHNISLTDSTHSGQPVEVYDRDWTYNWTPALNEAGLFWTDCDGKTAAEVGVLVNAAYIRILGDPERYRPLIRGGGASKDTGTLEQLLHMLAGLAAACRTHHAARFDRF